jgi:hypothetical protein
LILDLRLGLRIDDAGFVWAADNRKFKKSVIAPKDGLK